MTPIVPDIGEARPAGFDYFVQVHLTERCNLACTHCYQSERPGAEMDLADIDRALANISDAIDRWSDTYDIAFATSFNVTGGEPFLRNDLDAILRKIAEKGFDSYVLTNGTIVDRERSRMLANIPVAGVQISIEGPEAIHESIRGKGSFNAAMRGIGHLLHAGLVVNLNVTLSELNADSFPAIVEVARDAGVQRLGFSRLVPHGKGLALTAKMLDRQRLADLYRAIASLSVPGLDITTGDPLANHLAIDEADCDPEGFPLGGCAAAISGVTVLPDGTLSPCRRIGVPIGNILTDDFRDIWANSPVLNALRDRNSYRGKCRDCRRWSSCRGCRAIACACSPSSDGSGYLDADPQCFY